MDSCGSVLGQKPWEMTEAGTFDKDVHKYSLTPRDLLSRADIKAQKYSRNTEKSETLCGLPVTSDSALSPCLI